MAVILKNYGSLNWRNSVTKMYDTNVRRFQKSPLHQRRYFTWRCWRDKETIETPQQEKKIQNKTKYKIPFLSATLSTSLLECQLWVFVVHVEHFENKNHLNYKKKNIRFNLFRLIFKNKLNQIKLNR